MSWSKSGMTAPRSTRRWVGRAEEASELSGTCSTRFDLIRPVHRPSGGQMRRVFLVEDEALIRLILVEMIEELGHRIVAEAGSIKSAMHLAETAAFDIAILDVNIGGYYIDE